MQCTRRTNQDKKETRYTLFLTPESNQIGCSPKWPSDDSLSWWFKIYVTRVHDTYYCVSHKEEKTADGFNIRNVCRFSFSIFFFCIFCAMFIILICVTRTDVITSLFSNGFVRISEKIIRWSFMRPYTWKKKCLSILKRDTAWWLLDYY